MFYMQGFFDLFFGTEDSWDSGKASGHLRILFFKMYTT